MTREDLNHLRILREEIEKDIRQLRNLEKKERSVAQYGQSLLHSLKRRDSASNLVATKAELIYTIAGNQRRYLALRAELEDRISRIPNHYVRVALSLVYVDGMTAEETAAVIRGSCTGKGISQLLTRYFEGS